jgi:hypothetical protein
MIFILTVAILGWQTQAQVLPFVFWKAHNMFTWMGGGSQQTQIGLYGTKGTGSTANGPGPRYYGVSWVDASGNHWLFGGYGYSAYGDLDLLNDLWKYNPTNGQWTWVSGSSTQAGGGTGTYGTKGAGNWVT